MGGGIRAVVGKNQDIVCQANKRGLKMEKSGLLEKKGETFKVPKGNGI